MDDDYSFTASAFVAIFLLIIAWVSGLLRFYVRALVVKCFGVDDWLALLSLLLFIGPIAAYLVGIYRYGLDSKIDPSQLGRVEDAVAVMFISELFYIVGTGLIKISFGVTLLRFLQESWQRWLAKIVIAMVLVYTIIMWFIFLNNCAPIPYAWQRSRDPYYLAESAGIDPKRLGLSPRGHCITEDEVNKLNYSHAAIMLFTDLTLGIILPILVMRKVHVSRSLKVTTCAVLALGAIAGGASISRLIYSHNVGNSTNFQSKMANISSALDFFIITNPVILWTYIEYGLCLLGANCSTLKPLLKKLRLVSDSKASDARPAPPRVEPQLNSWHSANSIDRDLEQCEKSYAREQSYTKFSGASQTSSR